MGLSEETRPAKFVDGQLRQRVLGLMRLPRSDHPGSPIPKRIKLNVKPSALLDIAERLCQLADADPSIPVDELECRIMLVSPWLFDGRTLD